MTLENVYVVSQIVAAVVVVATLFAILAQANQTNRIAKADLTLHVWAQTGTMQYSLADSPEKADFLHRRALFQAAPLTDSENLRFRYVLLVTLGTLESGYNLRARGLIEAEIYDRMVWVTRQYVRSPRVRQFWKQMRDGVSDASYRDLIDGMVSEIETKEPEVPSNQQRVPAEQ